MRILKEEFGESYELNEFMRLLNDRYRIYFQVELKNPLNSQIRYFRDENAAKKYFDKLKEEMSTDSYYEDSEVIFSKIELVEQKDDIEDFDTYSIEYNDEGE